MQEESTCAKIQKEKTWKLFPRQRARRFRRLDEFSQQINDRVSFDLQE
jgi:hypothetical protein